MTREETKVIIRAMMRYYPNYKPDDISETIDAWYIALQDMDYQQIQTSLLAFVRKDRKGFAPSVGQLMETTQEMFTPQKDTAQEEWVKVRRAISNGLYNAEKGFNELSPLAQKAVGGAEQITMWARSDAESLETIARSQFIKAYNIELQRAKEYESMPKSLQALSTYTTERLALTTGEKITERERLESYEHTQAPANMMQRLIEKWGEENG